MRKILCDTEEKLTTPEEDFIFSVSNTVINKLKAKNIRFPMVFGYCDTYTRAACEETTQLFPDSLGLWVTLVTHSRFGAHTGSLHQVPIIYFNSKFYFFDFSNFSLDGKSSNEGTVYISQTIFKTLKKIVCESDVSSIEISSIYLNGKEQCLDPEPDVIDCSTLDAHRQLIKLYLPFPEHTTDVVPANTNVIPESKRKKVYGEGSIKFTLNPPAINQDMGIIEIDEKRCCIIH